MADSIVTIGADLSALRRELGQIPSVTDKEAQKMLMNLERAVRSAEKAARASTTATSKAMQAAARSAKGAETAVGDFGGKLGSIAGMLSLPGLEAASPVVRAFGDTIEALSSPVGAVVFGMAAWGAAMGGLIAGSVALVASSDDLIARLDEIGRADVISEAQTEQLANARDGLDAIKDVGTEMALVLAADVAPAVERVAVVLVGLGIKGREALETVTKHVDVLALGLDALTGGAIGQARMALDLLGVSSTDLGEAATGLVSALEDEGRAYVEVTSEARKLHAAEKERNPAARATGERAIADALREEAAALREIQGIEKAATPALEGIEATFAQIDAINQLAAAHASNAEIQDAAYQATQALALQGEMQSQEIHAAEMERAAERRAAQEQSLAAAEAYVVYAGTVATDLAEIRKDAIKAVAVMAAEQVAALSGGVADLAGALADSGKLNEKAAMQAYKIAKSAGLTQVAISTAIAIAKAGELGPFFAPIGIAAAIASGAAQAVAIQTAPPPSFFAGGAPMAASHPDATSAVLHRGERVQPAASVRRDDRGDMRAGMSGSQAPAPVQIQIMYGGRALDTVVSSEAQRPGSALRMATGTPRLGQRTR